MTPPPGRRGKLIGPLPDNRVLVTGAPRSATTFVGKVLSWPRTVDNLHEPLNPRCGLPSVRRNYLDLGGLEGQARDQLEAEVDGLLRYEPLLRTGHFARDQQWRRLIKPLIGSRGPFYLRLARMNPWSRAVVWKDPFAAMSVEALADRWGFRPVLLVRHPLAFVSSLERLGWDAGSILIDLADQPSVLARLADEDLAALEAPPPDPSTAAAVLWRITTRELTRVAAARPSVLLVTHEAVSNDAVEVFRTLYAELDLPWTDDVRERIEAHTTAEHVEAVRNRTQSFARDSRALLDLRLRHIDPALRARLWDLTGAVAEQWYEPEGVRPEAAVGLVQGGAPRTGGRSASPPTEPPDRREPPATDATTAPGLRRSATLRTVGPVGIANGLEEKLVAERARRWLAPVLEASRTAALADPIEIVLGGTIDAGRADEPEAWSPPLLGPPHRHVLMGVGSDGPGATWLAPTTALQRHALSRHLLHAVRDEATRARLLELGIGNVVVTGCPSTWGIGPTWRSEPGTVALLAVRHTDADEPLGRALIELVDARYERAVLLTLHPEDRRWVELVPDRWEVVAPRVDALDGLIDTAGPTLDVLGTAPYVAARCLEGGARCLIVDGDPATPSVLEALGVPTYDRSLLALRRDVDTEVEASLDTYDAAIDEWLGQFLWAPPSPSVAHVRSGRANAT